MRFNWDDFRIILFSGLFFANLYNGNDLTAALMLFAAAFCSGIRNLDKSGKPDE